MTLRKSILEYLEEEPKFRERRNKDRGIVNLLLQRYQGLQKAVQAGFLTKEALTALVGDYNSMDRQWRKCLEENPGLRGSDYDQKDHLEAEKMAELGYNPPSKIGEGEATAGA